MHRDEATCAEIDEGLHGFLRIHVLATHEPRGRVRANRQERRVERAVAPADFGETPKVSGVAGVIHAGGRALDDEAAPERRVDVVQATLAPVLRGYEVHAHVTDARARPPRELR